MADQSSINAAEAKAAGLSYGQYMAMKQRAVQTAKEQEGNRVCVVCGNKFFGKGNKMCCSSACSYQRGIDRTIFYQKQRIERLKEAKVNDNEKECIVCGDIFQPKKVNQKTCCKECSEELNRIRQRERNRMYAEERSKK